MTTNPENDFELFVVQELKEIKQMISSTGKSKEVLYDNADLMKITMVTERTLTNWRKKGILKFKKIGGKIYYTHDDVQEILRRRSEA